MKSKILNFFLIVTSLLGYLEWGKNTHTFLFQAEFEILMKILKDTKSVLHPFTILPLIGQLILIITLFQKTPSKILTYIGIVSLSVLLLFMFLIGLMSMNYKIIFSTIPFIVTSILAINHSRKIN